MATKTTFIATAPDGTQIKRGTARVYTHAVLCLHGDTRETATWGQLSFNGREDLAVKESKRWRVGVPYCDGKTFFEIIVVPVVSEAELRAAVAEAEMTEQADVDAAEAILAEGTPTADGGLVLEAPAKAEPVTTFYVTRDTDNSRASDEDRAMAHVSIHQGTDLAAAQTALKMYVRDEADYLTRGRSVTNEGDLWAFKRATALMDVAAEVRELDPRKNPGPHKVVSRYVCGLRFSIIAQTR
ncbi:hypothetical protein I5G63_gp102 [Mycobacterium phage Imvubu]|uniref:Uncharacterized protein n=1 Tax=Mycobacterium phage Imvubu TaxID=2686233 RepID=A0A6B9L7Q4_9CAUD|nr:hypothetical protein I5G63_gp102 [Mycobacterium phage Imvubu]QHB37842.1 hypothetical protein PBI_IMVUBU_102 [Mycobacterium phage Imvubu]